MCKYCNDAKKGKLNKNNPKTKELLKKYYYNMVFNFLNYLFKPKKTEDKVKVIIEQLSVCCEAPIYYDIDFGYNPSAFCKKCNQPCNYLNKKYVKKT